MAIVRELANLVRFVVDRASLRQAEEAISSVKRSMGGLDNFRVAVRPNQASFEATENAIGRLKRDLAGIRNTVVAVRSRILPATGGAEGEGSHGRSRREGHGSGSPFSHSSPFGALALAGAALFGAEEFVTMTNEWAALSATIAVATRNQNDFVKSRDAVLQIARTARIAPEPVANLFANLRQVQDVAKMSDDDVVKVTGIVTRGLAIAHQSAARNNMTIRQIDNILGRGKLTQGQLNMVRRDNNLFERLMEDGLGGKAGTAAFLKSSKNNAEGIKNIFLNMAPVVAKGFAALPLTFTNAMAAIKVDLTEIFGKVFVETEAISDALTPIVAAFDWLVTATDRAAKALGGYRNLATALEIGVIAFLSAAIAKTAVWAAEMAIANAPWLILAGLIFAAGLAIQDFWVWMHGGKSVIGHYIGQFKEWKPEIDKVKAAAKDLYHQFILPGWHAALDGVNAVLNTIRQSLGLTRQSAGANFKWAAKDVFEGVLKTILLIEAALNRIEKAGAFVSEKVAEFQGTTDKNAAGFVSRAGRFGRDLVERTGSLLGLNPNPTGPVGDQYLGHSPVADVSSNQPSILRTQRRFNLDDYPLPTVRPSMLTNQSTVHNVANSPNVTFNTNTTVNAPGSDGASVAAAASKGAQQGIKTSLDNHRATNRYHLIPGAEAGVATN